jgi:hypothetical protein
MALIALIGLGIGIHLALVVLFGVSLAGVLYWVIPFVAAFLMALAHPHPARSRFMHLHGITSRPSR